MALPKDELGLRRLAAETELAIEAVPEPSDADAKRRYGVELLRLGEIRALLDELEEADRRLDEAATVFGELGSATDRQIAAMARIKQVRVLMKADRSSEALDVIERLVSESGGFPQLEWSDVRVDGIEAWLWLLEDAEDPARLYDAAGVALARLDPAGSAVEQAAFTQASVTRARTSIALGRDDEALELLEAAIPMLEANPSLRGGGLLVASILMRAGLLAQRGREDEAAVGLEQFISEYSTSTEPWAREAVAAARAALN